MAEVQHLVAGGGEGMRRVGRDSPDVDPEVLRPDSHVLVLHAQEAALLLVLRDPVLHLQVEEPTDRLSRGSVEQERVVLPDLHQHLSARAVEGHVCHVLSPASQRPQLVLDTGSVGESDVKQSCSRVYVSSR